MEDQYGSDFITIVDEDGKEYELEVLSTLEVSILKSTEEDGEPLLTAIEDEEELRAVYDLIMEELYAEDETEEEDE